MQGLDKRLEFAENTGKYVSWMQRALTLERHTLGAWLKCFSTVSFDVAWQREGTGVDLSSLCRVS